MVDLEVAGVNDESERGPYGDPHGVGNGVTHAEELDAQLADGERFVGFDDIQTRVGESSVFPQFHRDKSVRQPGRVDGYIDPVEDVGQRADVVFVPVGYQNRLDLVAVLNKVRDIGDDEIDSGHVLLGKQDARVDDHGLIAVLNDHHILADLAEAAQRDDAQRSIVHLRGFSSRGNRGHTSHSTRTTVCE